MKVFTIGFTRKSACRFFGLLRDSGARRVTDRRGPDDPNSGPRAV